MQLRQKRTDFCQDKNTTTVTERDERFARLFCLMLIQISQFSVHNTNKYKVRMTLLCHHLFTNTTITVLHNINTLLWSRNTTTIKRIACCLYNLSFSL